MNSRKITLARILAPMTMIAPLAAGQRGVKPLVATSHGMPEMQKEQLPDGVYPEPLVRPDQRPVDSEAQAPASLTATGPVIDFEQIYFDRPGDGNLWVRGATYKARFGADAVEFVPFLGAQAPRNFPVRFTLESISVGETQLELARDVEPLHDGGALSSGGDVIYYDRGSVVEHYVIETDSIEQRFRFDRPLDVGGDLLIRVAVSSDLDCAGEDADGFCFSNELGGVRYGRAVVIDDTGWASTSPTRLVDGTLELEVPADFLARAQYPLTVDPLVSAFTADNSSQSTANPDVAFDETNQAYAVVWEHYFSQNDNDIWVQTHSTTGSVFAGSGFWIDSTSDNWLRPKIANNNRHDQFMVVAIEGGYSGQISGRTRDAGSINMGLQIRVDGQEIGLKSSPDIAGDPDLAPPTYYGIVWQNNWEEDDIDIHARVFRTDSVPHGPTFAIDGSTNHDYRPTISNSCGSYPWGSQRWTVVWTRQGADANTYGCQMNWNGIITEPSFPITTAAGSDLYPTVSTILDGGVGDSGSGPRPYLVAWVKGGDIWGRVMQASTPLTPETNLTALEGGSNQSNSQLTPAVESDGSTFVLAYAEARPGTSWDIFVAEYDYAGGQLYCTDPNRLAAGSTPMEINPMLASRHAAGGYWGSFMAVWHQINGVNMADAEGAILYSQSFGHTYCTSNSNTSGNVGHVRMEGSRSVANQTMTLTAEDCPALKPGLFFLGNGQVNAPFGEGRRCVGGAVKRFQVIVTDSAGIAYQPINFNANYAAGIAAGGPGVNYQFWFRDPAGGPAGFNVTDGLHVEHTP